MSGEFLFDNTLTARSQDTLGKLLIYIGYLLFAIVLLYAALKNKVIKNFMSTNIRVMNSVIGR